MKADQAYVKTVGRVYSHAAAAAAKYCSRTPRLWRYDAMKAELLESLRKETASDPRYPAEFHEELAETFLGWCEEKFAGIAQNEIVPVLSEVWKLHKKHLLTEKFSVAEMEREASAALNAIDPRDEAKKRRLAEIYFAAMIHAAGFRAED